MVCGMREMAFKILRYIALYVLLFSYFLLTLSASFLFVAYSAAADVVVVLVYWI